MKTSCLCLSNPGDNFKSSQMDYNGLCNKDIVPWPGARLSWHRRIRTENLMVEKAVSYPLSHDMFSGGIDNGTQFPPPPKKKKKKKHTHTHTHTHTPKLQSYTNRLHQTGGHFMKLVITGNLSFTDKYSDILDFDWLWSTVIDCCHGNSQWMTNCQWWQVSWNAPPPQV